VDGFDHTLILPTLLKTRATEQPDRVFLQHVDGKQQTYSELEASVRAWMGALQDVGVVPGDRVVVMLPPSFEAVAVWMAAARLQAIETPINTALKGNILGHVIADAAPRCSVVHARFVERLEGVSAGTPGPILLVGDAGEAGAGQLDLRYPVLDPDRSPACESWEPREHDIATIIYTSGTTGRSKGVLVPWRQEYATARWTVPPEGVGPEDAWYGPWPPFHVSGKLGLYYIALAGGRLIIRETFSTSSFWNDIREFGATCTMIVASTVSYLSSQPPSPRDRDHPLRNVFAAPMPLDSGAFKERFGVRLCTAFNMTETSSPIVTGWESSPPGSCGRLRPGAECRIVDETDAEVPTGKPGELLIRMDSPWETMAGYLNAPEATVEAWRNLWFHTGDAVRRDAEGYFYFLDRMKYTIRRRGENISSMELEAEVDAHPCVRNSAAIGVPSPWGEQDVKVFVVLESGAMFEPADLIAFLEHRVPSFMLPRFVVTVDAIPQTATHRAKKEELRDFPVDERTWDREVHLGRGARA
jgi:crotonobetaine/carnitine-CoA ligase